MNLVRISKLVVATTLTIQVATLSAHGDPKNSSQPTPTRPRTGISLLNAASTPSKFPNSGPYDKKLNSYTTELRARISQGYQARRLQQGQYSLYNSQLDELEKLRWQYRYRQLSSFENNKLMNVLVAIDRDLSKSLQDNDYARNHLQETPNSIVNQQRLQPTSVTNPGVMIPNPLAGTPQPSMVPPSSNVTHPITNVPVHAPPPNNVYPVPVHNLPAQHPAANVHARDVRDHDVPPRRDLLDRRDAPISRQDRDPRDVRNVRDVVDTRDNSRELREERARKEAAEQEAKRQEWMRDSARRARESERTNNRDTRPNDNDRQNFRTNDRPDSGAERSRREAREREAVERNIRAREQSRRSADEARARRNDRRER